MIAKEIARRGAIAVAAAWPPYSRLFLVGEGADWVIDHELRAVSQLASRLGIAVPRRWPAGAARDQSVFYGSHFTLFDRPPSPALGHRLATTYFHGVPGTPGFPEFDDAYRVLRRRHTDVDRVQVSHREIEEVVLSSGIDPAKVFRIPIGVETRYFGGRMPRARHALGLPDSAFVVGSFQKDGVGWAAGLEPKWIKGPDVLVDVLSRLHHRVPELHVVLSGPARGYVRARLEEVGIPYVHRFVQRYRDIGALYATLDAYVVTSRQEGGPKAILESMAAGVPIVSTRVGQATDLVRDGVNGWLADVEDVERLTDKLADIAAGGVDVAHVTAAALETAAENSYEAQLPLWRAFFDGFVERRA